LLLACQVFGSNAALGAAMEQAVRRLDAAIARTVDTAHMLWSSGVVEAGGPAQPPKTGIRLFAAAPLIGEYCESVTPEKVAVRPEYVDSGSEEDEVEVVRLASACINPSNFFKEGGDGVPTAVTLPGPDEWGHVQEDWQIKPTGEGRKRKKSAQSPNVTALSNTADDAESNANVVDGDSTDGSGKKKMAATPLAKKVKPTPPALPQVFRDDSKKEPKLCSGCKILRPPSNYTNAQLKNKANRKCGVCVQADATARLVSDAAQKEAKKTKGGIPVAAATAADVDVNS
jgi:hypothetical protein